jgi:UDP-N-acetylglucosamine 2-epimerase (non-hydrolysing)
MTIVGVRPKLIKMCMFIAELKQYVNYMLVYICQIYDHELNGLFFEGLGIRTPNYFLKAVDKNPARTIARAIEKSDTALLYKDTNHRRAVIVAKSRKIPFFHMEAGNCCFDQRVPEDINRKVLEHLSDINLVMNEHTCRYVIAAGIRPETITKTGSNMQDMIKTETTIDH